MLIFDLFTRNNDDHYHLILLENFGKLFNKNFHNIVLQFETYTEQLR